MIVRAHVRNQSIFATITAYFRKINWEAEQYQDDTVLQMRYSGSNGEWMCYAQAREEQQQFAFYSVLHDFVPTERIPAVAEFLTRANFSTVIGNFELDWSDGEVRYKTSTWIEGNRLNDAHLSYLIRANLQMMDEYLPGLRTVIEDSRSPADAVSEIED